MNVKELRIGNIIGRQFINRRPQQDDTVKTDIFLEPCTVNEIKESSVNISDLGRNMRVIVQYEYVEPIPITAEWLERLGFKEYHSTDVVRRFESTVFDDMVFHLSATNYVVVTHLFVRCEYVHQLQNICFVLKGEELTRETESK